MRKLIVLAALFVVALTGSAFAQTADEVILLAQKGVGDDVLMAFVEASKTPIVLSVADLTKLKDAKVPDKVVVAMLQRHPPASAAQQPPVSQAAPPAEQPRAASQDAQPQPPVTRSDSQAQVDSQPAPQPVVVAPATTYVYSSPPYVYGSYYYPYYPYYYPYYPGVYLGFRFGGGFRFRR